MKSIIKVVGFGVIILLTVLILASVTSKSNRSYEIKQSLNTAIQQSAKVLNDERYKIESDAQMVAEFNRNLLLQLDSNSKISVEVYSVDYEKGMLDTQITLTFQYPHGKEDTVKTRKTVLLDDIEKEE